jgi:hypothetical protein
MWILIIYILIVLVGEAAAIAVGLFLDRTYPLASLPVSLSLFFIVLWLGWVLAVWLTKPKRDKHPKVSD